MTMPASRLEAQLATALARGTHRVALDEGGAGDGLLKLALTIVRFLHDLLEKQAIARMEAGQLDDEQIERIGRTLLLQAKQLRSLCDQHGIDPDSLELDLGPLGRL